MNEEILTEEAAEEVVEEIVSEGEEVGTAPEGTGVAPAVEAEVEESTEDGEAVA